MRLFAWNGDAIHLRISNPVMKNPEVATRCDKNAATEVLQQSTFVIRRMGPGKFTGKGAKTVQYVAPPMQKNRLGLRHYWRQAIGRKKFSQRNVLGACFLRWQNILFDNISLATRATLSGFSDRGGNFRTCSVAISEGAVASWCNPADSWCQKLSLVRVRTQPR